MPDFKVQPTVNGVPVMQGEVHAAAAKTTPVDADEIPLVDSAASFGLKRLTWANLKLTLKPYLDTLYGLKAAANTWSLLQTFTAGVKTSYVELSPPSGMNLMGYSHILVGSGNVDPTVVDNMIAMEAMADYAGIAVDLLVVSQSGGHTTVYSRRITAVKPPSAVVEGVIEVIGTDRVSGAGIQGTITINIWTGAPNYLNIYATGVGYNAGYTYIARIISTSPNAWRVTNQAA